MKVFILLAITFLLMNSLHAQTIPSGYCGIQYTYDAAGNRTKQEYICAPCAGCKLPASTQPTSVLYPNPTTGRFSIRFTEALHNAIVYITDVQGKVLQQLKGNSYQLNFDIGSYAAGIYFLKIMQDDKLIINEKIIKQ